MAGDTDINTLPVSLMPRETRILLSRLLNSPKIIPSDEPDKLPRDWRGLAHLANVPSSVAASIHQSNDKTARVLEIWLQQGTPTVGTLLQFMQRIDRYDAHDDILNALQGYVLSREIDVKQPYPLAGNIRIAEPVEEEYNVITVDDYPGYEHQYHAFVLYADEDKEFVDELYEKLGREFQICTTEKLLPGHATQYAPIARLLSKRCLCIILVYSPDFLRSSANTFFGDYAQAVTIESKERPFKLKIIPIMYRECKLPLHLMYYHKLYYKKEGRAMYDFWDKLKQALDYNRVAPRNALNGGSTSTSHSSLNIVEVPDSSRVNNNFTESQFFLTTADQANGISMNKLDDRSRSMEPLTISRDENSGEFPVKRICQNDKKSLPKEKGGTIKKFINKMNPRKNKKGVLASTSAM